ncbi:MAG: radical SAM protein [Halieaceae bacterium]|jgi:AdoMet-dependent heme synthase|nr:radical SAM protein [Halieaceae bacterium]
MDDLYLLAINLTRRCNLACDHCYLDAKTLKGGDESELGCEEVCSVLDEVADRSSETMVVLTGGEPLLRPDLEHMVSHGAQRGLSMVVGTNGMLLTERRVVALKNAGLMGAGISVDSLNPDYHDSFRGLDGSWHKTMAGIEACRNNDLFFQVHFTVTQRNADELPAMIAFCRDKGARVLNVFFLICTGRGESVVDISPRRYEQIIGELIEAQANNPDLIIRPRCAPHYKRIAHQLNPEAPITHISGQQGDGCIAATHYCRITPAGEVTACPYIEEGVGNIRQQSFMTIWDQAPQFVSLRNPDLSGKCGECEYRKLCGGCRARPVAMGNDILAEDPWCDYQPSNVDLIEPWEPGPQAVSWSEEAEVRLGRIPGFVRKMVRKKAEAFVQGRGELVVTVDHLNEMTARRFGHKRRRPPIASQPID